jgi:hypothetical protein
MDVSYTIVFQRLRELIISMICKYQRQADKLTSSVICQVSEIVATRVESKVRLLDSSGNEKDIKTATYLLSKCEGLHREIHTTLLSSRDLCMNNIRNIVCVSLLRQLYDMSNSKNNVLRRHIQELFRDLSSM